MKLKMAEFIALAAEDELHAKILEKESKGMENMRMLAFQVSEDLFQRIKEYLRRNNMTQKQFVIGLIEDELERDEALLQGNGEEESAGEEDPEEAPVEQGEGEPNPTISNSGSGEADGPKGTEAEEDFADKTPSVSADDFEIEDNGNDGEEEGQDYNPEM